MKTIALLFRTQAYASLYTGEDVVYRIKCYSDDLTDAEIATPGYSGRYSNFILLLDCFKFSIVLSVVKT